MDAFSPFILTTTYYAYYYYKHFYRGFQYIGMLCHLSTVLA
jgi:hypothetical protein